jgi:hypothetical protein
MPASAVTALDVATGGYRQVNTSVPAVIAAETGVTLNRFSFSANSAHFRHPQKARFRMIWNSLWSLKKFLSASAGATKANLQSATSEYNKRPRIYPWPPVVWSAISINSICLID